MEKKNRIKLKEKLMKEKKELEKVLSSFAKKSKRLKGNWETIHPLFGQKPAIEEEDADEVEEYTNLLPVEYRIELKLLDIKRALEKIEKGKSYGACEKCGKRINIKRLEILPGTKHCSKCAVK